MYEVPSSFRFMGLHVIKDKQYSATEREHYMKVGVWNLKEGIVVCCGLVYLRFSKQCLGEGCLPCQV